MENQILGFEEIKKLFPDEWVLLGNPEHTDDDSEIVSGILIFHAKDKKEIAVQGIKWRENFETATLKFTGIFPRRYTIGYLRVLPDSLKNDFVKPIIFPKIEKRISNIETNPNY